MKLWRISNKEKEVSFIRASTMDEAEEIYNSNHNSPALSSHVVKYPVQAIFFTDCPFEAVYFKGTKTNARKAGMQYIRQWRLDAAIDRVITM